MWYGKNHPEDFDYSPIITNFGKVGISEQLLAEIKRRALKVDLEHYFDEMLDNDSGNPINLGDLGDI